MFDILWTSFLSLTLLLALYKELHPCVVWLNRNIFLHPWSIQSKYVSSGQIDLRTKRCQEFVANMAQKKKQLWRMRLTLDVSKKFIFNFLMIVIRSYVTLNYATKINVDFVLPVILVVKFFALHPYFSIIANSFSSLSSLYVCWICSNKLLICHDEWHFTLIFLKNF